MRMSQLKLLLDTNTVIALFETGLWDRVVERCEVFLSRIVVEQDLPDVPGTPCDRGTRLSNDIESGRVRVFEPTLSELKALLNQLGARYFESLDWGEAESLACLLAWSDEYFISSSDAIVCRLLGRLHRGHQGISLEELLQNVLLSVRYTKAFREHWTQEGE